MRLQVEKVKCCVAGAVEINSLPIIGKVENFDVAHLTVDFIVLSITAESERMKQFFHSSLKSYRRDQNAKLTGLRIIKFHRERFEEGVQVFRKLYMNL